LVRLVGAVANVYNKKHDQHEEWKCEFKQRTMVSSVTISLLGLHFLVNEPERMKMSRDVSKAVANEVIHRWAYSRTGILRTYMVKQMLIIKSQLHPAMKAAAAGGKMMATYA